MSRLPDHGPSTVGSDRGYGYRNRPDAGGAAQACRRKIQRYLASEELERLLPHADGIRVELYLDKPDGGNAIGLYRNGTRILPSIVALPTFDVVPWTDGRVKGVVDVAFLNLTPGTRDNVIQDRLFEAFCTAIAPVRDTLLEIIEEHRRAEEEKASVVRVGKSRALRAVCRDRAGRAVDTNLDFFWEIVDGDGQIDHSSGEIVTFDAPDEPCVSVVRVSATQGAVVCTAESVITIADQLVQEPDRKFGNYATSRDCLVRT